MLTTIVLLDLIRKVEPFNEEPLSETVYAGRKRPNRVSWTSWVCDSRGGRRRWCSMDRCGNRVKAQRHYEKSRNSGH